MAGGIVVTGWLFEHRQPVQRDRRHHRKVDAVALRFIGASWAAPIISRVRGQCRRGRTGQNSVRQPIELVDTTTPRGSRPTTW